MFKQFAVAALLAIASSSAFSQQTTPFYVGADYGTTKADGVHHKHGFGYFAGYKFNAHFAVEGGFHRLSKSDGAYRYDLDDGGFYGISGTSKLEQLALSVVGTLPLSSGFSAYGRLGVNRLKSKGHVTSTFAAVSTTESYSDSENKVLYGVGLSYAVTPAVAARFEVQKPHNELTRVALGVSYAF